jgi:hypothetical protein
MCKDRPIESKIFLRLVSSLGALFLASSVFSLAMHAKLCQYVAPKHPLSLFSFKATKEGEHEGLVIADRIEKEDFIPCPFVSDSFGAITSLREDIPTPISAFLAVFPFRSPPV